MDVFDYIYNLIAARMPAINEKGQSTAEYSLVILGAAAVALLLLAWTAGSGSGSINNLFESVIARVTSKQP